MYFCDMIIIQDIETKDIISHHTTLVGFRKEYGLTVNQWDYFRRIVKKGKSTKYKKWIIYKT